MPAQPDLVGLPALEESGEFIAPVVVGLMIGSYHLSSQSVFLMFAAVLILTALNVIILGEETKGKPMG